MHQTNPVPPAPGQLSDTTVAALRAAIVGHARAPGEAGDPATLRAAVGSLARDARERAVTPEQLLIGFKAVWHAETAVEVAHDRATQTRLYEELVTLCIREYFAGR